MWLDEYKRTTVENFMGLWNRGSFDDIPPDHATDCHNMAFSRKREVLTRPGSSLGRNIQGTAVRQFIAAFSHGTGLIPLHFDGQGTIWRDDTNQPILTISGMIDVDFLNMNGAVYIAPMFDHFVTGGAYTIYVWEDSTSQVRQAAGIAPDNGNFSISASIGTGHTGPGWYGVSVSYVTSTGFVTAPAQIPGGGWQTVYLPPSANPPPPGVDQIMMNISGLEAGKPPGAVSMIIWVTQGQQDDVITLTDGSTQTITGTGQPLARNAQLFQYEEIPLTTPSPIFLNFYDTDLTVSADNLPGNGNILNSLPTLPIGIGFGSASLAKYHGRMIIIGTQYTQNVDPNNIVATPGFDEYPDDRVWISNAGQPETFDRLTGYVDVQSEFDGNIPRTGFELFGVFYICKAVGTFATQDTGSEPNDPTNPWKVNLIDGGIGAYHHAVGTISGSQPSLSFNSTGFLANRNGLFLFNGNVLRPELTWKIRQIWGRMTHGAEYNIRVAVDIYNDLFYVLIPADGQTFPSLFLVGDYSLGLDAQNIRWATYNFPFSVRDIMMGYYSGDNDGVLDYFLRMGSNGAIYKLDGRTNTDVGSTINNYYTLAPLILGDPGAINICRYIRYRCSGYGTLFTSVTDQGDVATVSETNVQPLPFPGNYKDQGFQLNFLNEKAIIRFGMNAASDSFRMARVDVFGKVKWPKRPNG